MDNNDFVLAVKSINELKLREITSDNKFLFE